MATAKSPKKTARPLKERAVQAALLLAAQKSWADVSMHDIARACKCDLAALHDLFADRQDILAAYGRLVDRSVIERVSANPEGSERDRLFDVLMERFDVLNEHRGGVKSILQSFRTDPKVAVASLPHLGRSMVWMLEAAGIDANGPRGAATALGLTGVYLCALKSWMDDDSEDMGKTMAALDRGLERAEKVAEILRF